MLQLEHNISDEDENEVVVIVQCCVFLLYSDFKKVFFTIWATEMLHVFCHLLKQVVCERSGKKTDISLAVIFKIEKLTPKLSEKGRHTGNIFMRFVFAFQSWAVSQRWFHYCSSEALSSHFALTFQNAVNANNCFPNEFVTNI